MSLASVQEAADGTIATLANVGAAYGEMYQENTGGGTTLTITTNGTYYGCVAMSTGDVDSNSNVTFDANGSGNRLTCHLVGEYELRVQVALVCILVGTLTASIHKNGSPLAKFNWSIVPSADLESITMGGFIALAVNDYLDLRFTATVDGTTLNTYFGFITLRRVR